MVEINGVSILPPVETNSYVPPGVEWHTIQQVVSLETPGANFPLNDLIPYGAGAATIALSVPKTISATTAVKIGIGRVTATADPDKYLLTPNLTAGEYADVLNPADLTITDSGGETIAVCACDTNGAAAGTIGGVGEYVVVRLTYLRSKTIY